MLKLQTKTLATNNVRVLAGACRFTGRGSNTGGGILKKGGESMVWEKTNKSKAKGVTFYWVTFLWVTFIGGGGQLQTSGMGLRAMSTRSPTAWPSPWPSPGMHPLHRPKASNRRLLAASSSSGPSPAALPSREGAEA